jgi:hypothetical protein
MGGLLSWYLDGFGEANTIVARGTRVPWARLTHATEGADMPDEPEQRTGLRGAVILFALGLLWLAGYLWSAHAGIVGTGDDPLVVVTEAAMALPGLVAATTLAGAATSNAALRLRPARGWVGFALAAACGLAVGGLAGALVLFGYGHRSSVVVLAWAVLAAGVIGGLLGSLRPADALSAGLAATFGPFLLDFLPNIWQGPLLRLFGAGTTVASRLDAARRLSIIEALTAGLVAGLVAFWYLRRVARRSGAQPAPDRRRGGAGFLGYLAAGATPGLLLLTAEAVTRIGGARLFDAAGRLSAFDHFVIGYTNGSRLNHDLAVLFVGALASLICFGATLKPANRPRPEPAPRRETAGV